MILRAVRYHSLEACYANLSLVCCAFIWAAAWQKSFSSELISDRNSK